jgi:hypothetical protein
MDDVSCIQEVTDLLAHAMSEALIALDPRAPYDEANIRSLSPRTQELIAKLREDV